MLGILNNTFKPTLVQKFSSTDVYNTLDLPMLLFEIEICILKKRQKTVGINRDEIFQKNSQVPLFAHKRMKKFRKSLK
jgi:hypothetical protein